jgi:hypothetical protein
MKSSLSIFRRLVRNISEMYIAKPAGEADSFPCNLSRVLAQPMLRSCRMRLAHLFQVLFSF